jgi:hypothetical protein
MSDRTHRASEVHIRAQHVESARDERDDTKNTDMHGAAEPLDHNHLGPHGGPRSRGVRSTGDRGVKACARGWKL